MESAHSMGFNTIFLNPVFQSGFSGSLYSIKDHLKIDQRFLKGRGPKQNTDPLKKFIQAAHKKGLKVLVDLVINHTAIDSPLLKKHPSWFLFEGKEPVHPGAFDGDNWVEWGDLAQVDNRDSGDKKGLYEYWGKVIDFYQELGFDGFRADAAYQIPVELWSFLIARARKKNPGSVFLAETLGCEIDDVLEITRCGFDYTFNSVKYWDYREPWSLEQLHQQLIYLKDVSTVGFPESHDTARLYAEAGEDLNRVKAKLLNVFFWSEGMMIPSGFESCARKRLSVVETAPQDQEPVNQDLSDYLKKLLELKRQYRIFSEDSYIESVIPDDGNNVLALLKISRSREERALFLLNTDFSSYERIFFKDLARAFKMKGTPIDLSLEYPMDLIPAEFEYHLRPGQVKLLYMTGKAGILRRFSELKTKTAE